jgi:hypothetical protein
VSDGGDTGADDTADLIGLLDTAFQLMASHPANCLGKFVVPRGPGQQVGKTAVFVRIPVVGLIVISGIAGMHFGQFSDLAIVGAFGCHFE